MSDPAAPTSATACDPDLRAATPTYFDLRNRIKPRNFITAEVTQKGYLKFYVENLPRTHPRSGCPGRWLFQLAWDHFASEGVNILGIRGDWTFGDNLDEVNRLTANSAVSLEDAALVTWTGIAARGKGFTTVSVLDADGGPGNYKSVDVVFLP